MKKKISLKKIIFIIAIVIMGLCFGVTLIYFMKNFKEMNYRRTDIKLQKMLSKITVETMPPQKAPIKINGDELAVQLPDVKKYPLVVEGNGEINIEICSSTEKSGKGTDGWLNEVAEKFNQSGISIKGKKVTVSIRPITSGLAVDYIASGRYLPDAFTPANELWGEMLISNNVKIEMIEKRLAGNVAGILLSNKLNQKLVDKYGTINIETIMQATMDKEMEFAYTNPLVSSTGMNFLLSTLYTYNPTDLFSDIAIEGFKKFQSNVSFVAYSTIQMRDVAKSRYLRSFILEYQTYLNEEELDDYTFIPFGVRHDNPLYSIGSLSKEKEKGLKLFVEYCKSKENQKLAYKYGFNHLDEYKSEIGNVDGDIVTSVKSLWKKNKNTGKDITAVFVSDISENMKGEPLEQLKKSLLQASAYIKESSNIGFVSYNDNVYLNLPIGKFDFNQRTLFNGAVESLQASGDAAAYDGLAVAIKMLLDEKERNPNTKLMLCLFSNGVSNTGHTLEDISNLIKNYNIPVYTIGYNGNIDELEKISELNEEAVSINADLDDVFYKLKSLFEFQM